MKSPTSYLFLSISGPFFVLAGIVGMIGFGLPDPYWRISVLIGGALILFSQRQSKQLRRARESADPLNDAFTQKRHRFWIFVAIASAAYAAGSFWVPVMTPELRTNLIWMIMLVTFGLCIGIFLYSMFTKKKP